MIWGLANSNLALVKYWGKADEGAKHPAGGSLSVTLDSLVTAAGVELDPSLRQDEVIGLPDKAIPKVVSFLDAFRARTGNGSRARVRLSSNFPVAAGLASSASTFAALAQAIVAAHGIPATPAELADLARLGSGSACRSVFGGFVEWRPIRGGSVVEPVAPKEHWDLAILVAVTSERPKDVGSSEGMKRTAASSPYYPAWIESGVTDLAEMRGAVAARDLGCVGEIAERNCMRMHAAAMAANPPLLYWEAATIAVIRKVWELRARGLAAYFSIDAGPQVKVLCARDDSAAVVAALASVAGVVRVIQSKPGDGPRVVAEPPAWVERVVDAPAAKRAVAS